MSVTARSSAVVRARYHPDGARVQRPPRRRRRQLFPNRLPSDSTAVPANAFTAGDADPNAFGFSCPNATGDGRDADGDSSRPSERERRRADVLDVVGARWDRPTERVTDVGVCSMLPEPDRSRPTRRRIASTARLFSAASSSNLTPLDEFRDLFIFACRIAPPPHALSIG